MPFPKAQVLWIFAYIQWRTVEGAHGRAEGLGEWFLPTVSAVTLGPIGLLVWRARRRPEG